jgi:hypothetical protein
MKQVKKLVQRGLYNPDKDNPFDLFLASARVRWTYYKETENILGQTFGMCVLQVRGRRCVPQLSRILARACPGFRGVDPKHSVPHHRNGGRRRVCGPASENHGILEAVVHHDNGT